MVTLGRKAAFMTRLTSGLKRTISVQFRPVEIPSDGAMYTTTCSKLYFDHLRPSRAADFHFEPEWRALDPENFARNCLQSTGSI